MSFATSRLFICLFFYYAKIDLLACRSLGEHHPGEHHLGAHPFEINYVSQC